MVKECKCICKEKDVPPEEWKGLTKFKITELDVLRGPPGSARTHISLVIARDKEEAIKKYYDIYPGASNRILIYPEGCADIYKRSQSTIAKK